jgi:uncharacterized membrane protein YeaQ/YmgE (transglycosylase-associated protein family)
MFIVVIGAVAGWVAGQFVKRGEEGVVYDIVAGAIGAVLVVFLARLFGPTAAGMMASAVIAIIGAVIALFAIRKIMKSRLA